MKISKHKLCQFIAKKYIKSNINWPREIKIAKMLIEKYPEYIFWNSLRDINLPSLAWFLNDKGKDFLFIENKKTQYDQVVKENIILSNNKLGEDKKICKKPKTLLEFIRYGKKA